MTGRACHRAGAVPGWSPLYSSPPDTWTPDTPGRHLWYGRGPRLSVQQESRPWLLVAPEVPHPVTTACLVTSPTQPPLYREADVGHCDLAPFSSRPVRWSGGYLAHRQDETRNKDDRPLCLDESNVIGANELSSGIWKLSKWG